MWRHRSIRSGSSSSNWRESTSSSVIYANCEALFDLSNEAIIFGAVGSVKTVFVGRTWGNDDALRMDRAGLKHPMPG
nr:hypothetical protein E2R29_09125 [Burkholderia pseudomallei]